MDLYAPPKMVRLYGSVKLRLIHHVLQKLENASDEKGGPLSVLTNLQAPYMLRQVASC